MKDRIYLDCNSTTGLDPEVLQAMLPELSCTPANPSSAHTFGQEAKKRLQHARETIAGCLRVKPHEILFTSGGTEGLNLLVRSFGETGHTLTSNIEHSCIYNTLQSLEKRGTEVTYLPAGLIGAISSEAIESAIRPNTRLIVLSSVNNETGIKHDIEAIAKTAHRAGIPLVIDAVAQMGKEQILIPEGVTAMAFSAHKFHGPKGTGFLFLRSGVQVEPLITGGNQEFGKRAGTENLPGIVGMAKAVELLEHKLPAATSQMAMLRDKLEGSLLELCNPVLVNGAGPRSANVTNLCFPHLLGEDLLIALDMAGIATSHGSACSSGALEPSRILLNMGLSRQMAKSSLRFSLSRCTTEAEIDRAIAIVSEVVKQLRR